MTDESRPPFPPFDEDAAIDESERRLFGQRAEGETNGIPLQ